MGITILFMIFVLGSLYVLLPDVRYFIQDAVKQLAKADIEAVKDYLLSFGAWAPIVSALLMIISVLIAPLPAFVPTFANGLLFGAFWGGLLSWSSALLGATLCFYMSRGFGRPVVEKMVSKKALDWMDRFFKNYGIHSIIIARVVPIVSYGIVSYAAGLTSMRLRTYLIGTAIGQTPATILYSYLGEHATESMWILFWAFVLVICMVMLGSVLKPWIEKRMRKKGKTGSY